VFPQNIISLLPYFYITFIQITIKNKLTIDRTNRLRLPSSGALTPLLEPFSAGIAVARTVDAQQQPTGSLGPLLEPVLTLLVQLMKSLHPGFQLMVADPHRLLQGHAIQLRPNPCQTSLAEPSEQRC